jgi:Right handed beta helix region
LITEHSIEENIFLKAKQKRNLDLIVMDEGKFDSSHKNENDINFRNLYSNGGIFDILGVDAHERSDSQCHQELLTSDQVAKAMVSLEDAEDAAAMKVAQKEVEDELKEFDESVEYKKEEEEEYEEKNGIFLAECSSGLEASSISNGGEVVTAGVTNEEEILKDFNEWQNQVGMAPDAIEASLSSTEKYALNFRENVDPYCSIFAIMEERRRLEVEEDRDDEVDAGAFDEQKAYLEKVAFDDGDLLGTTPLPADLPRLCRLYQQEKAHLRSSRTRRKLNGENWIQKVDGLYKHPFWYNEDTGEGVWEMPSILKTLEADAQARAHGWTAIPLKPLLLVMSFLIPFPERKNASYVCHHWKEVATDASFILHVLPVEAGSAFRSRKLVNHFDSILDALQVAQPGDTIELGDGHYWINDPGLSITFPIRIIGDESDPSHVVIELSGTVKMISTSCFVEGVTFRRPQIASSLTQKEMLLIEGGQCDMVQCIWNNQGDNGIVAVVSGAKCKWDGVTVTGSRKGHGIMVQNHSCLHLENCSISRNQGSGIICSSMSFLKMNGCVIKNNSRFAVQLQGNSSLVMTNSELTLNVLGLIEKDAGSTYLPITNPSIFQYHPNHCTSTESLNI